MTQTIEQLQARVAELTAEMSGWRNQAHQSQSAYERTQEQLAIAEEHNARLMSALIATRDDLELRMKLSEDDSLNISNSVLDQMLDAIDIPASREALDAYVAEQAKQYRPEFHQMREML